MATRSSRRGARIVRRSLAMALAPVLVAATLVAMAPPATALDVGDIDTVAGGGALTGNGTPARSLAIRPGAMARDAAGNLIFFDHDHGQVIEIPAADGTHFGIAMTAGDAYTIAGTFLDNAFNPTDNVAATSIPLSRATQNSEDEVGVAIDAAGNLYLAQGADPQGSEPRGWLSMVPTVSGTHFGRAMTAGNIYRIAGTGNPGMPTSGADATATPYGGLGNGIVVDGAGNVLIADALHNEVLAVAATAGTFFGVAMQANHLYNVAGNGTAAGAITAGANPRGATLRSPDNLALDADGDLLIAEDRLFNTDGGRIKEVPQTSGTRFGVAMAANKIYVIAGDGGSWTGDTAVALNTTLYTPAIAADAAGNLFLTDPNIAPRVWEIAESAHTDYGIAMAAGSVYRIAGTTSGDSGDGGPALGAQLNQPRFLLVDAARDVFVSDVANLRIRVITGAASSAAVISGRVTYLNQGQVTGAQGVLVQACNNDTNACSAAAAETVANGNYSVTVSGPGTYVVTAYPPPASVTTRLQGGSTDPVTVGVHGAKGVDLQLQPTQPLPPGLTVGGVSGGIPRLLWGNPTPVSVEGCPNGQGYVLITGTNEYTAAPALSYVNLVETPAGSGHYKATVPPLEPIHGDATIQYVLDCSPPTALVPASGPTAGGNTVEITGSGLSGATAVKFGSKAATRFSVVSDTEISAVAPAGSGSVTVSVMTPSGAIADAALGEYTYLSVTGVNPRTAGAGATVTITGTGFGGADALFFGTKPATDWSVDSDTSITATVPAGAGSVDVTVDTSDGGETGIAQSDVFGYGAASTAAGSASPVAKHTPRGRVTPDGFGGGLVASGAGAWTSASNYIAKYVNIAINTCAGSNNLRDALGNAVNNELNQMRRDPDGVITASIVGGAGDAIAYLGAGLLGLTGASFAAGVATIAFILAIPALVAALQAAASNPNLDNCLKKFFPKPPKPPATPKKCKGPKCKPEPGGGQGNGLVDPSGTIVDGKGNPLAGATVTLLRSDTANGTFTKVPEGSPLMEPATNPETTAADGIFHWDVAAGYYQVTAAKSGCAKPGQPGQSTVSTPVFPVPPPQVGLLLTLSCASESPPPTPTVTDLFSSSGPAAGGDRVTLTGTSFTAGATVHFGAAAATGVTVLSPTSIQAAAPAGTGTVHITVTTASGTSPTGSADRYAYRTKAALASLAPTSGPANGGTVVKLSGSGFGPDASVFFGTTAAASVSVTSAQSITAVAPGGSIGSAKVRVVTTNGTTVGRPFTYTATASRTTVRASHNPVAGGSATTFTASVAPTSGGGVPAGAVAFVLGAKTVPGCAARPLDGSNPDSARCVVRLPGGTRQKLTARYLGGQTFAPSTSAALTLTVRKQATRTTLQVAPKRVRGGDRVRVTAIVIPGHTGRPGGRVAFLVNGHVHKGCGAVALARQHRDAATCRLALPGGSRPRLSARYIGDHAFAASRSRVKHLAVGKQPTRTKLHASANPVRGGKRTAFVATVVPAHNGRPSGRVAFLVNGHVRHGCGAVRLARRHQDAATCRLAFPAGTTPRVTARYRGDHSYAASISKPVREVVRRNARYS